MTIEAHGGELIDRLVDEQRAVELRRKSRDFPSLTLSKGSVSDLELLMNGGFSPLKGFMGRKDYETVLETMYLSDGTLWPLPVCLDFDPQRTKGIEPGTTVALRDVEGFMLAVLHVDDVWEIDRKREALLLYGTDDPDHPGVFRLLHQTGSHYVGGSIEGIQLPIHSAFKSHHHTPRELRALFRKMGWRRIVGFHTRHPIHRAQYAMTLLAMERSKANLLIHPVVWSGLSADIDTYTRIHCYLALQRQYPASMMQLSLLPYAMREAGPKEALLHAIIRKNYGCTHFIVGPHHASPQVSGGKHFYGPDAAIRMALDHQEELGIAILDMEEMVYLVEEDRYVSASEVPSGAAIRSVNGEMFLDRLRNSRTVPTWYTFADVLNVLRRAYPPRHEQGFTIFCTGLSGAGKSTIAKILYARFQEMGRRPVTLLDGDIVRQNLSNELGFSREHRDINVRRIGFVASEITKNRGIAICAPIAPYAATRNQIRNLISRYGGFIEVYVATPIEVCEMRDRKGLYAKARAGLIPEFTGVSDPYEPPQQPEVTIDTTEMTPDEAAQEVLLYLERAGYARQ
ncbi:MAG: bifunctional sulfate adenylyltransferase/adenylylsulfate kinase [Thermodesulfobacteriota bacterium]